MSDLFRQIPGSLVQIAADSGGAWGVNASQDIFVAASDESPSFRQIEGKLIQIAFGGGSRKP